MGAFDVAFKLTAWFETGDKPYTTAVGNFDKQGLSWGPRQTCIGQGSLQPLMRKMLQVESLKPILAPFPSFAEVARDQPTQDQLYIVNSQWNDERGVLRPKWRTLFETLGMCQEVQQIFYDDAKTTEPAAKELAQWLAGDHAPTVREFCLAYDFVVQNGSFHPVFKAAISTFLAVLSPFQKDPKDRLRAICWLRAGWTYIRGQKSFASDVLARKLLIVEGRSKFRGEWVDLDQKFGVTDDLAVL